MENEKCKCIEELTTLEEVKVIREGGGTGTDDYTDLTNKPQINGHELAAGNNTLDDIGAQPKGDYALKSEIPETSEFITKDVADLTNYTTTTDLSRDYATKGEIPSLDNYYTKDETYSSSEIDQKVKEASGTDLSAYLKKEEASETYLDKTTASQTYATKSEIPDTKDFITETTADNKYASKDEIADFVTESTVDNKLTGYAKSTDIADFIKKDVSDLTNYYDKSTIDSKTENFITKAVDDLTNYYLKTETYNQTEIDQKINTVISGGFKKVEQLPDTGESKYIYLVPAEKSFSQNIKNEFIWLDDEQAFEQIGSTQLDLEPYATIEMLNQKLQDYATKVELEEYYKKTETYSNTEVDNKVDEETRDLLKTLSRELKPDEEDENGYSSQTLVNVKNKSDATELIVEIDNLDVKTNVAVNSVLGTLKGQDLEDRLKAVEGKQIPVIEKEATISEEKLKSHTFPQLTLDNDQIQTVINNDVSILKVKYIVTKDVGTETDTMVFYVTIDYVENGNSDAVAKTVKINAIRTNDEGDIIYHGELLGKDETFATTVPLTARYVPHIESLKSDSEEDALSKSIENPNNWYYWVQEE